MDLNEFIKAFAAEFEETPIEKFTSITIYKDLEEWDSLTVLSIISMVDEIFEKTITGADLRALNTIEDLYNFLQSK
jgi:acyl carrier protein